MKDSKKLLAFAAAVAALVGVSSSALASSHREAPAIAEDQYADNTDVYTFLDPSDPTKIVFVANYVPLLLPASGPNYYRFSDNVLYEIKIDNNGDAVPDISYQWRFTTSVTTPTTFLYNTGAVASITDDHLNVRQVYTLTKVDLATGTSTAVATDVPVAPWNVGHRSFPGGYDAVGNMAIHTAGTTKSFAGPRDEPFFVDLKVFDLLGVGSGAPATTDGLNVMSLVLEVPITDIAHGGTRPAASTTDPNAVVGVYATASRPHVTILRRGRAADHQGQWVQVSRLGWPLVNEAVIPLGNKDNFNRTNPVDDVTNYGASILNPELSGLMIGVLGLPCTPTPAGGRVDLVPLLSPNGTTPADLLRINIGADQTNANSHFPNGRALSDDVTDTLLTVICNAPGVTVADGVNANDLPFQTTFPYLASPASGNP